MRVTLPNLFSFESVDATLTGVGCSSLSSWPNGYVRKLSFITSLHVRLPQLWTFKELTGTFASQRYEPVKEKFAVLFRDTVVKARGTSQTFEGPTDQYAKTHLIVLVNGLFGSSSNWAVTVDKLQSELNAASTVVYTSETNQFLKTFEGIDTCGERLAREVRQVVSEHPNLQRVSFIGHSMGGLIARYAIGRLYDPSSDTLCALTPSHFVSLATPHLGCDVAGAAQVPLIEWSQYIPGPGLTISKLLQEWSAPVTAQVLRRSGRQFFLQDGQRKGKLPLLYRMAQDEPGHAWFKSGLAAFRTRTCYANCSGDHLVGWANSSLRHPEGLPVLQSGKGVVREDNLDAAFWSEQQPQCAVNQPAAAAALCMSTAESSAQQAVAAVVRGDSRSNGEVQASDRGQTSGSMWGGSNALVNREDITTPASSTLRGSYSTMSGPILPSNSLPDTVGQRAPDTPSTSRELSAVIDTTSTMHGAGQLQGSFPSSVPRGNDMVLSSADMSDGSSTAEAMMSASPYTSAMLCSLQELPWRRIDVCFRESWTSFLAHNHIQVTRKWLNTDGEAVAEHLAKQLALMDKYAHNHNHTPPDHTAPPE